MNTSPRFPKRLKEGSLKNFLKNFWESRVLGALSKLDEFLLNPQVRTCSVAVPGTSRKNSSENWEPTGDRFLGNPCPEEVFSTYHSCNLNDPEQEETHHNFRLFISAHIYNMEGKSSSQLKENQRVFFTFT